MRPAPNTPMPEIALEIRLPAEKSTPSLRRPVLRSTVRIRSSCSPRSLTSSGARVDQPALVVFRGARIEAQRPSLEVELSPLEAEDLLHSPPEAVGDRDGGLKVRFQSATHRLVLRTLEKPFPWSGLLELPDHRQPRELPVLVGEPEHPSQEASSRLTVPFAAPSAWRRWTYSVITVGVMATSR